MMNCMVFYYDQGLACLLACCLIWSLLFIPKYHHKKNLFAISRKGEKQEEKIFDSQATKEHWPPPLVPHTSSSTIYQQQDMFVIFEVRAIRV